MKTSRTLTVAAVAALITSLQLGAIAAAFSLNPTQTDKSFAQQSDSQASLDPIYVVASRTD